jgi:hypothetical protein
MGEIQTISRGIAGGGESNSARKAHARRMQAEEVFDRCQILFIRPPLLMFVRLLAALITNILYSF